MQERNVRFIAQTRLPTEFGFFNFRVYENHLGEEITAVVSEKLDVESITDIRLHSACFTSEVLHSLKCDCKHQLDFALDHLSKAGGIVIYLPQEGRGIGLGNKVKAYSLQEDGLDTIAANELLGLPVDARNYEEAAHILRDIGITKVRIISNNPEKKSALEKMGFDVCGQIPIPVETNLYSNAYLETKRDHMDHDLQLSRPPLLSAKRSKKIDRPYVHVNFAISESGNMVIEKNQGDLSCEQDWQRVHELRERYDAVVVGAKTWITDRPRLTCRAEKLGREPARQPDKVVFVGNSDCELGEPEPITPPIREFHIGRKFQKGCIPISASDRSLRKPLQNLLAYGVESLLVEGGPTLLQSFVDQNLVDRYSIYVATQSKHLAQRALTIAMPKLAQNGMSVLPFGEGFLISIVVGTGADTDQVETSETPDVDYKKAVHYA